MAVWLFPVILSCPVQTDTGCSICIALGCSTFAIGGCVLLAKRVDEEPCVSAVELFVWFRLLVLSRPCSEPASSRAMMSSLTKRINLRKKKQVIYLLTACELPPGFAREPDHSPLRQSSQPQVVVSIEQQACATVRAHPAFFAATPRSADPELRFERPRHWNPV